MYEKALGGERGAFCKHQLALSNSKELSLPNLPPVTFKERQELACLALGDKAHAASFFMTDVELLGGQGISQLSPASSLPFAESEEIVPDSQPTVVAVYCFGSWIQEIGKTGDGLYTVEHSYRSSKVHHFAQSDRDRRSTGSVRSQQSLGETRKEN